MRVPDPFIRVRILLSGIYFKKGILRVERENRITAEMNAGIRISHRKICEKKSEILLYT